MGYAMASWTDLHQKVPVAKAYALHGATGLARDYVVTLLAAGREVSISNTLPGYPIDMSMCLVLTEPMNSLPVKRVQGIVILLHPLKQKGVLPIDLTYPTGPVGVRDLVDLIEKEWHVSKKVAQTLSDQFSDLDSLYSATLKWKAVTTVIEVKGQSHLEKLLPLVLKEDSPVEKIMRKSPTAWDLDHEDCTEILSSLCRYISTLLAIMNNTTPDKSDITVARDMRMRYTEYMQMKPMLSFYTKDRLRNLLSVVDALTPFAKMPECFRMLESLWN